MNEKQERKVIKGLNKLIRRVKVMILQDMIDYCSAPTKDGQTPNDNEYIEFVSAFTCSYYPEVWKKLKWPNSYTPTSPEFDARVRKEW